MLVLTRKPGESIQIGDDITIFLLELNGNQQRIGIEAPRDVTIHRSEIYDRINHTKKGINI